MSETTMSGQGFAATRLAPGGRSTSQGMFGGIALVLGIVGFVIAGTRPNAEDSR